MTDDVIFENSTRVLPVELKISGDNTTLDVLDIEYVISDDAPGTGADIIFQARKADDEITVVDADANRFEVRVPFSELSQANTAWEELRISYTGPGESWSYVARQEKIEIRPTLTQP